MVLSGESEVKKVLNATLKELGFGQWFLDSVTKPRVPDCEVARVTEVNRDSCLVRGERGEMAAELTGAMMYSAESSVDLPSVGDFAFVQYHNGDTFALIHELLPRRTFLRRKTSGSRIDYQMIAANIDVAFIVQSCDHNFNIRRLERYLVMTHEGGVEPVLLLTKSDLVGDDELEQRVFEVRNANIGCAVNPLSNKTGAGLDQVRDSLRSAATYCLIGSSGVGKTTLLNNLIGQERFHTREVREQDGKGRHATTRRQLVILEQGAMVVDTPGMRELGNIGVGSGIDRSFADIAELIDGCRFNNCTHTEEVGCALIAAVESGELSEARYGSYLKLRAESEFHQLSYLEKRNKDRKFGQMIKTVKKQNKKNR